MKKAPAVKSPTGEANGNLIERFASTIREAQAKNITLIRYNPATGEAWRITPDGNVEPYAIGPSQTDWERVASMSDEEAIANALSDPDAQPWDEERLQRARAKVVRRPVSKTS